MSEDYKAQASVKFGGDLFNFRGESAADLAEQLEGFAENAERIYEAYDKIRQVTLAKGITAQTSFVPATSGGTQHTSGAEGASSGGKLECRHGPYKDFKGKTKRNGEAYQYRYYCSAPFGAKDQCKAADLPGQESWTR